MPVVFRGALTGRFYYARRVQRHRSGTMMVVGDKVDITEQLLPYLKKRYIPKDLLDVVDLQVKVPVARKKRSA